MASKATRFKSVVVKEIPRTSLAEAGIHNMTLADGNSRVVAVANAMWPHHDRNLYKMIMDYIADFKPAVVVLDGQMIDHEAFKSLTEDEKNYLHRPIDMPEVTEARKAGIFDDQLKYMREKAGEFIASFGAHGAKVIYIPGVRTEHKLMEWVQQEKETRDNYVANNPDRSDDPTDPSRKVPTDFAKFLYLNRYPRVKVLGYESALLVNDHSLYLIGDFKRRHPGDAAYIEWEQRGYSIIRSFGGMKASAWHSTTEHSQPALKKLQHQTHELGYIFDDVLNGHLRDYDRRAPGFFSGEYRMGELFGETVDIIRGDDGRRSFLGLNFQIYTEDSPGGLETRGVVDLGDEPISPDDDWKDALDSGGDEGDSTDDGAAHAESAPRVEAEIVVNDPPKNVRAKSTRSKKPAAKRTRAKAPAKKTSRK